MIIGIDISQIVYNTGVSRYTKELFRNLLRIDKKNQYKLFAGVFRQKLEVEKYIEELRDENLQFTSYIKLFPPNLASKIWNNIHAFPIENFIGKIDVLHTSDFTNPPTKAKKITTIHDLTPLIFPQYHLPHIVNNFKINFKLIEKECDFILAVSNQTKTDIQKFTQIPEEKIQVIYEAVDSQFKPTNDQDKIIEVKKRYGITRDYILSVGTKEPRKNIDKLIKAFFQLNLDIQLVLVGKSGWLNSLNSKNKNIIETGFIEDEDLPILYSSASVFTYPSLYEGFGLPVLEAMSCGAPVIISNNSSLPEVVGKAGILINPNSTQEIKEALEKVLTNKKLQKELSQKSQVQAQKFNWQKTAKETLEIYNSI